LPENETELVIHQKREKKAVDATISDDGQTRVVYIKYDDGSMKNSFKRMLMVAENGFEKRVGIIG
jgi:hypothetical protein